LVTKLAAFKTPIVLVRQEERIAVGKLPDLPHGAKDFFDRRDMRLTFGWR